MVCPPTTSMCQAGIVMIHKGGGHGGAFTAGFDLAKNVCKAHGADDSGRAMLRTNPQRDQVLEFCAGLRFCVFTMKACGGT
ncbi:hypothetical protein GGQ68_001032 [Sagittula marina]|uniref:Uncharacterized protein n=1 Tax=Sagittula marina TaxID=943940 RepID=A0A7W6DNE6_9RHOB|nr:hypothetical protein [Sagittula marina]